MKKEIINEGNKLRVYPDRKLPYCKGIGEIIFETLQDNQDSPMQIDGLTGEIDTYKSFLQRSIRTSIKMRAKGIKPGDIISVCSHNHLNTLVPIMASYFLGSIPASIDPCLSLSDSTHLLGLVKPKMIFVSPNALQLIEEVVKALGIDSEIVIFGDSTTHTEFNEFLKKNLEEESAFHPIKVENLQETAAINFSSGSTGLAKAVCLSHISMIALLPSEKIMQTGSGNTQLNYSSAYWVSCMQMFLITIKTKGIRLVYPKFEVENFWEAIGKYKVFFALMSPTQIAILCSSHKPDNLDTSNLKVLFAGGSTVYKQQLDKMHEFFPTTVVGTGYGQTELGPTCFFFDLDETEIKYLHKNPTSCGRPQPGFEYKVVDLETEKLLGPYEKGELRVKTNYCMNGYYGVDSSSSWDSEGFLKTGDIVYYDEDYCFFIVDRIKEMLKYQGWHISPAKLESILLTHPEVEVALVIGLPHPVDVDLPTGIVQLKRSDSIVTSEDLEKYYEEKIDDEKHRLRGGLKIIDNIPTTPTGKFRKKHLKDMILAGLL